MKKQIKHIEPGNGLGQLLFGLKKSEVLDIIGEPDRKFKENFENEQNIQVWEYEELGLSLRFVGDDVLTLGSLSIISSFYEYNGVRLIGKDVKAVRDALRAVDYEILYYSDSADKKLLFSKELSLTIIFEYNIATSLSWDTPDQGSSFSTLLKEESWIKSRKKRKKKNLRRIVHRGKKSLVTIPKNKKPIPYVEPENEELIGSGGAPRWAMNIGFSLMLLFFGGFAYVFTIDVGMNPGTFVFGGIAMVYLIGFIHVNFFKKR